MANTAQPALEGAPSPVAPAAAVGTTVDGIVPPGETATAPATSSSAIAVLPKEGNRQNKPATPPHPAREGTRATGAAHSQSPAAPPPGAASPDAAQRSRSTLDGFANPFER